MRENKMRYQIEQLIYELMQVAFSNPENFECVGESSSVIWNFVDSDAYVDLSNHFDTDENGVAGTLAGDVYDYAFDTVCDDFENNFIKEGK